MAELISRKAKHPVTKLAGPYGHPFHPILVTVPIGAWVASFVFDIGSRVAADGQAFVQGAYWLIALGILGALAAAAFGLMDLLAIPRGTKPFTTGITHMILNLTVVALFAVGFALRRGQLDDATVGLGPIIVSAVALGLLGASGWLGGMMTYRYGVRVADEETQEKAFRGE